MIKAKDENLAPQSSLGRAIAHAKKVWPSLLQCLKRAEIYLDSNISERALRQIALGKKL